MIYLFCGNMMIFENMLRKRHQAEKTMYYIIPFITVIQSQKIYMHKKQSSS